MDYTKSIELNPNDSSTFLNRGSIYGEINDYESAIADFDKAIILNPKDSDSYIARGNSKFLLGQTNKGCLDWQKADELGNTAVSVWIKKYCN